MPPVDQDGNVLLSAAASMECLQGEAFPNLRFELLQQSPQSDPLPNLNTPLADELAKSEITFDQDDHVPAANLGSGVPGHDAARLQPNPLTGTPAGKR